MPKPEDKPAIKIFGVNLQHSVLFISYVLRSMFYIYSEEVYNISSCVPVLIHKFFFLLPMNIDKTSIQTFLSPEIFAMLSDHTYSAKCSRCEVCPDCGLDPKIHYKKEEVPKLLTSKIFRHQFIYDVFVSVFKRHTL